MTSEAPRPPTGGDDPQIDVEELITAQARVIGELRARVDALESRTPGDGAPDPHREGEPGGSPGDGRTGRRQLLSLAGMAAAGAVAGTTVLTSQATPAASSGTFDGNPAVLATSPTVAIRARVTNGAAIDANAEGDDDIAVSGGVVSQIGQTNTSDGGGFLEVFKPGSPVPTASAINWSSGGQNIANSATARHRRPHRPVRQHGRLHRRHHPCRGLLPGPSPQLSDRRRR